VVRGSMNVRVDGEWHSLGADEAPLVPIGVRHRVENIGIEPSFAVFSLSLLAPEPQLGHVDTEPVPRPEVAYQPIANG
jgi:putative monooxygenase